MERNEQERKKNEDFAHRLHQAEQERDQEREEKMKLQQELQEMKKRLLS